MSNGRNKDLLVETRHLLNVLNEENANLKSQNEELTGALGQARREKDKIEADMKKINFGLMEQLQRRTATVKELETQIKSQATKFESEDKRSTDSLLRLATLDAELTLLKEQLRNASEQNDILKQRLLVAEDVAARSKQELESNNNAIAKRCEWDISRLRDTIDSLEGQLRSCDDKLHNTQRTLDAVSDERNSLQFECDELKARDQSEGRAASLIRGELALAHEHNLDGAIATEKTIGDIHASFSSLSQEVERLTFILERIQLRNAAIMEAAESVRNVDDLIIHNLVVRLSSSEAHLSEDRKRFEVLEQELSSTVGERDHFRIELERYKAEITDISGIIVELQEEVNNTKTDTDGMRSVVAERDREIERLREIQDHNEHMLRSLRTDMEQFRQSTSRVIHEKTSLEDEMKRERSASSAHAAHLEEHLHEAMRQVERERERCASVQERCEREMLAMRAQMDDHTATVSEALGKLRSTSLSSRDASAMNSRATSLAFKHD